MEKETQVKVVKNDNSLGSIRIADEVVSIIAGLAATEVDGIAGMSGRSLYHREIWCAYP